jgi:uncharacterized protein YraI
MASTLKPPTSTPIPELSSPTATLLTATPTLIPLSKFNEQSEWATISALNPVEKPIVTAKNSNVNLRKGPGTNYEIVGTLLKGQSLEIIGRNTDSSWWQISDIKGVAWIAASVVMATNIDDGIPVVETPPPPIQPTPTNSPSPIPAVAPTSTASPVSTPKPIPTIAPVPPASRSCCKMCGPSSKACGDSCISLNKVCRKGPGCACD